MQNNKRLNLPILFLLVMPLLEVIDAKVFLITIPGFPLSLGRLLFIIAGLIGYFRQRIPLRKNIIFIGLFLLFSGIVFSSFITSNVSENLLRSIASLLLVFGATGLASLWRERFFIKILDIFFISTYFYWGLYVLTHTAIGEGVRSYGELYGQGGLVNHHVVGICLSISTIYLCFRYFIQIKITTKGYVFLIVSLCLIFLTESRSNFLFTIITVLLLSRSMKIIKPSAFFRIIIFTIIAYSSFTYIASKNDSLSKRFNLGEKEYQTKTTGMRIEFIELAFIDIINNPLGKGLLNIEVIHNRRTTLVHNQYLTYMLAGGIISTIGIFIWIASFIRQYKITFYLLPDKIPLTGAITVYLITLATVEFSGLLLFFVFSWQIFLFNEHSLLLKRHSRVL